jgi:hypothetical protein
LPWRQGKDKTGPFINAPNIQIGALVAIGSLKIYRDLAKSRKVLLKDKSLTKK